jgi:FkbM family methyltransferase
LTRKLRFLFHLIALYWNLGGGWKDFFRLILLRLSTTSFGALLKRRTLEANLPSLGGKVFLRTHSTDISVLSEIFLKKEFAPVFREMKQAPTTLVDLGANTGLVSRLFLARYPEARLLAVEPEPGNFALLLKNLAPPGLGHQEGPLRSGRLALQAFVGAQEGTASPVSESGEWGYRMDQGEANGAPIPVRPLGALLREMELDRVSLLKCDIEGAEEQLFADCREWIESVDWMLVECHPPYSGERLQRDLEAVPEARFQCRHRQSQGPLEVLLFERLS